MLKLKYGSMGGVNLSSGYTGMCSECTEGRLEVPNYYFIENIKYLVMFQNGTVYDRSYYYSNFQIISLGKIVF